MRVEHVSGERGTLVGKGPHYASVVFDGDDYPSTVAVDAITPLAAKREESKP